MLVEGGFGGKQALGVALGGFFPPGWAGKSRPRLEGAGIPFCAGCSAGLAPSRPPFRRPWSLAPGPAGLPRTRGVLRAKPVLQKSNSPHPHTPSHLASLRRDPSQSLPGGPSLLRRALGRYRAVLPGRAGRGRAGRGPGDQKKESSLTESRTRIF